jgi:hypothetical protein
MMLMMVVTSRKTVMRIVVKVMMGALVEVVMAFH